MGNIMVVTYLLCLVVVAGFSVCVAGTNFSIAFLSPSLLFSVHFEFVGSVLV